MEDYDANKPTRSSFVHGASVFQSQFGPTMTSMLGDAHTAKVDEGPKTLKIGTEAVVMPEKKSKKKARPPAAAARPSPAPRVGTHRTPCIPPKP